MAAIAAEAGVALKTVYVAFETKSGVLRALWNLLLRGDEEDAPVAERTGTARCSTSPTPSASSASTRATRAPASCASARRRGDPRRRPADPDIEALWQRIQTDYHDNQRAIVESLDEKDALKPGLDLDRATDILWTINHPAVWQLLVRDRGWTPEDYEQWFADAACAQLLPPAGREPREDRDRPGHGLPAAERPRLG